jgi:hypothetical protein
LRDISLTRASRYDQKFRSPNANYDVMGDNSPPGLNSLLSPSTFMTMAPQPPPFVPPVPPDPNMRPVETPPASAPPASE